MADTRPVISVPRNTWVDVYAALNAQVGFPAVSVGTQIRIQLVADSRVYMTVSAAQPSELDRFNLITDKSVPFINDSGDSGAWAYSYGDSLISVEVV